jgi:hypothetical protein
MLVANMGGLLNEGQAIWYKKCHQTDVDVEVAEATAVGQQISTLRAYRRRAAAPYSTQSSIPT